MRVTYSFGQLYDQTFKYASLGAKIVNSSNHKVKKIKSASDQLVSQLCSYSIDRGRQKLSTRIEARFLWSPSPNMQFHIIFWMILVIQFLIKKFGMLVSLVLFLITTHYPRITHFGNNYKPILRLVCKLQIPRHEGEVAWVFITIYSPLITKIALFAALSVIFPYKLYQLSPLIHFCMGIPETISDLYYSTTSTVAQVTGNGERA